MQVPRAKSIDEIYDEVEDYDLVLTADAPLADALTARVEEPRLGIFATTPRRLVRQTQQNTDLLEKRDLFVETVRRTELNWKQAIYLIDAVVDCWRHEGEPRAILDYDRFDTEPTRKVLEVINDTSNVFSAMQEFAIDRDRDVVIIGPHRFDQLDTQVLPNNYDTIEYVTDSDRELPEFKMYRNRIEIVRTVVNHIDTEHADDIAVVMDPTSEYPALLESFLETDGIPYMTDRTLEETQSMRTFITVLRRAFEEGVRVGDIRPLLPVFSLDIPKKQEKHYLDRIDAGDADEMQEILDTLADGTFSDAVTLLRERTELDMSDVEDVLGDLGLLDREVSDDLIDHLGYFLAAYDERADRSRRGVLLASATAAAYVDRPIVFYLGMGSQWTGTVRDRPWVDTEEVEEQHFTDFITLLQNGEQQHFLVQDREMNQDITPCLYFGEFTDDPIESFRDLPHTWHTSATTSDGQGFDHHERDVYVREETTISQSKLSTLVNSPKDYYFNQLVTDVDEVYFTRGILFHDFAEFYVNHPGIVEEEGLDTFVDIMMDEIVPHLESRQEPLYRTKFTIGCQVIQTFLDREKILTEEIEGYEPVPWDAGNTFADYFNVSITSPVTEKWFKNRDIGMQGIVDFIADRNHLVDHKSGGEAPSSRTLVRTGHVDRFEDDPDFQAPMYLAHHRSVFPDTPLRFTYFHFLDNEGDAVEGSVDVDDNIGSVQYFPRSFEAQIQEEHAYTYLNSANKREKVLTPLGFDNYVEAVSTLDIGEERWEKEAMVETHLDDLVAAFREHLVVGRGEDVTENQLEKGVRSILKQLVSYRKEHFFAPDLDRFEAFVQEQIANLNQYKQTGFPAGDTDRDELDNPDLVIR